MVALRVSKVYSKNTNQTAPHLDSVYMDFKPLVCKESAFLYTYGRFRQKVTMASVQKVKFARFLIKRLDFST